MNRDISFTPDAHSFDQFYRGGGYRHDKTEDTFQRFYWTRQAKVVVMFHSYLQGDVLDLGCGEGELSRFIPAGKLVLADIAHAALKNARSFSPNSVCSDSSFLPFAGESFDTVLFTEVIYHLPNPGNTLDEIYRVLRPGGTCIFTAGIKNSLSLRLKQTLDKWNRKTSQHSYGIFFTYYSTRQIHRLFRNSGFNIQVRMPYFFQYQPFLAKPFSPDRYRLLEKTGSLLPLFCRYLFIAAQKPDE